MSPSGGHGSVSRRKVGGRTSLPTYLIVCEGTKTEPEYFKGFKIPSVEVKGAGKNTKSLVDEAIRIKDLSEPRDHYWCVFDRDSFPAQNFNTALQKARAHGFQVAYSNECFEIWYLLHFDFFVSALARSLYADKLADRIGRKYRKNDPALFDQLLPLQPVALKNAAKLLTSYPQHNPEKDNPCTTVHLLVEQLRALSPPDR